jgi:hypothetical protein
MEFQELKNLLKLYHENLVATIENFKKSPKRRYTKKYLEEKLAKVNDLKFKSDQTYNEIYSKFNLSANLEKVVNTALENVVQAHETVVKIIAKNFERIEEKEQSEQEEDKELEKTAEEILQNIAELIEKETKMADFNIQTALKMPTLATVDSDDIRDFLNIIEAFNETIKTADRKVFIKFITRTKITGSAKTKLGDSLAESFEELSQQIKSKCGSNETYESLRSKLNETTLGNKKLETFADELNSIAERLAAVEIEKQGGNQETRTAIKNMAKRDALIAFKIGVPNHLRIVVEAARPNTMEDALAVASAATAGRVTQKNEQVFYMDTKCSYCSKPGHWVRDCRKKKFDMLRNGNSQNGYRNNFETLRNNGYQNGQRNNYQNNNTNTRFQYGDQNRNNGNSQQFSQRGNNFRNNNFSRNERSNSNFSNENQRRSNNTNRVLNLSENENQVPTVPTETSLGFRGSSQ